MISTEDVVLSLERLQLDIIDPQWVDSFWKEKFSSCPEDLPDDCTDQFGIDNFSELINQLGECRECIEKWLSLRNAEDSVSGENSIAWTSLQDVQYRPLLALLYFYIHSASENLTSAPWVLLGLESSQLYWSLLSIPGSSVFKIFQMFIFDASIEVLKTYKTFDSNDYDFTSEEEKIILKSLHSSLLHFGKLVERFSFSSYLEAVKNSLNLLVNLTRMERQVGVEEFVRSKNASVTTITKLAYLTLKSFCNGTHGRVSEVVRLIFCRIMPNLSLVSGLNL